MNERAVSGGNLQWSASDSDSEHIIQWLLGSSDLLVPPIVCETFPVTELENLPTVLMQAHGQAGFWSVMTRQMEQPATLPLRFPESPDDLRPSILEWQPYSPSPLDKAFEFTPTPSAAYEVVQKFPKTTTFKRPTRRKHPPLFERQGSSPSSLHTLVAGSSALLGALAVSILTPGSFPTTTTTTTKSLARCPTNWRDATHVGLGCVWAETRGGGVRSSSMQQLLSDNKFPLPFHCCDKIHLSKPVSS